MVETSNVQAKVLEEEEFGDFNQAEEKSSDGFNDFEQTHEENEDDGFDDFEAFEDPTDVKFPVLNQPE